MAKRLFAVCLVKADGKEPADGKEGLCHLPDLCRLLADGKEVFAICQQTAKTKVGPMGVLHWLGHTGHFFAVCQQTAKR